MNREEMITLPNKVLVNSQQLTSDLAEKYNLVWKGNREQTLVLAEQQMEANVPIVRVHHRIGFDPKTECYIMTKFAILKNGGVAHLNKEGFYDLDAGGFAKPFNKPTAILPRITLTPAEIWRLLFAAWGDRAATAIAWMIGGWFVNQIKQLIGFFPFLSFWGDPQTGKTFLTRKLNAMQALDEEGLSTRKSNTSKGEIRKLSQVSGFFTAILEIVKGNARFDMDQTLTMFNRAPLQVRAQTTQDNRTHELPFDGTVMFVSNAEPFESRPQRERAISVGFKSDHITDDTREGFSRLDTVPIDVLAGFFVQVMKERQKFETQWHDEYRACCEEMRELGITARLVETHSLIWAFHRLFCRLFGVEYDLKPFVFDIAAKKHKVCASRDETLADFFFGLLNEVKGDANSAKEFLKEDKEQGQIVFHLSGAIARIEKDLGKQIYFSSIENLQKSLRAHPAYIDSKPSRFKGRDGKTSQQRAFVFDLKRLVE